MKKLIKMMKTGDIIIIGLLVILSFLPLAYFSSQKESKDANTEPVDYLVVSVDGEELHRMELKDDYIRESYQYESEEGQINLIERDGKKAYMAHANCPDSLCVKQGEISEVGETIVCLPHRVLLEVVSESPSIENENEIDFFSQRK